MIDPLKDTTALIAQVRAGFVPQPEAVGSFGYDFRQAVEMIRHEGRVSTSLVQRHLQIGYNRAARIIERMHRDGLISAPDRTGKREIL